MKLKFKDQQFQAEATAAVCDVFEGQPYHDPNVYTVDPGTAPASLPGVGTMQQGVMDFRDNNEPDVGYRNAAIELPPSKLLENARAVQVRQNLDPSPGNAFGDYTKSKLPEFEVEMETGTGKTFVYTRCPQETSSKYLRTDDALP